MNNRGKDLVFFDDGCGLCQYSVNMILRYDSRSRFVFAPLNGQTAKKILQGNLSYLIHENSMVLLEDYHSPHSRLWIRGRAAFRILWLIGGPWKLLGWLCFIPFGIDAVYRLIAKHRYRLVKKKNHIREPKDKTKFLP